MKGGGHGVAGIAGAPGIKQQDAESGPIQSLGACTWLALREAWVHQGDGSQRQQS